MLRRVMRINWRLAWRATQPSENTFGGAAMIFRGWVDDDSPSTYPGPSGEPSRGIRFCSSQPPE
jgi:hypothetical protein